MAAIICIMFIMFVALPVIGLDILLHILLLNVNHFQDHDPEQQGEHDV